MKNIIFHDLATESIRECQHVIFDEAMNDLLPSEKPPNARLLEGLKTKKLDELDIGAAPLPNLDVSVRPFVKTKTVTVEFDGDSDDPTGLAFADCKRLHRAFVSDVYRPGGRFRSVRTFKSQFLGAYVVSIDGSPVFDTDDIAAIIARLKATKDPPDTIEIELAPERRVDMDDRGAALNLRMRDLRRICALRTFEAGEGMPGN